VPASDSMVPVLGVSVNCAMNSLRFSASSSSVHILHSVGLGLPSDTYTSHGVSHLRQRMVIFSDISYSRRLRLWWLSRVRILHGGEDLSRCRVVNTQTGFALDEVTRKRWGVLVFIYARYPICACVVVWKLVVCARIGEGGMRRVKKYEFGQTRVGGTLVTIIKIPKSRARKMLAQNREDYARRAERNKGTRSRVC
jgi:hypothetical protein